jgi:hypothetical protein
MIDFGMTRKVHDRDLPNYGEDRDIHKARNLGRRQTDYFGLEGTSRFGYSRQENLMQDYSEKVVGERIGDVIPIEREEIYDGNMPLDEALDEGIISEDDLLDLHDKNLE